MDTEFLSLLVAPYKYYVCYSRFKPGINLRVEKNGAYLVGRKFHTLEELERGLDACVRGGGTFGSKPRTLESVYAGFRKYGK